MKAIRESIRIWQGASRPPGDEITFEVPIKIVRKANPRKSPKPGPAREATRVRPGDSAL